MSPIVILYEDSAAPEGAISQYGPHVFVLQCVRDYLKINDPRHLSPKMVLGLPKKSNTKVLADCIKGSWVSGKARTVFAVYDADQIHRLTNPRLGKDACKKQIKENLNALKYKPDPPTQIVFLERNIETLLNAICAFDPNIVSEQEKRTALEKKSGALGARDIILQRAAKPPLCPLRAHVLSEVRSLGYLVQKLSEACMNFGLVKTLP